MMTKERRDSVFYLPEEVINHEIKKYSKSFASVNPVIDWLSLAYFKGSVADRDNKTSPIYS